MIKHARGSLLVKQEPQMRRLVISTILKFVDIRSIADTRTSMFRLNSPIIFSLRNLITRGQSLIQMKKMAHSGSNWVLKQLEDISQCSQVNSWSNHLRSKQKTRDAKSTQLTYWKWYLPRRMNWPVMKSASKTSNVITSITIKEQSNANFRRRATAISWLKIRAGWNMKQQNIWKLQLMDQKVTELIVFIILNSVMTKCKLQHAEVLQQNLLVNQQIIQNALGLKPNPSIPITDAIPALSWQQVHQTLRSVMNVVSKWRTALSSQWIDQNVNTGRTLAQAEDTHMVQPYTSLHGHQSQTWELIDAPISNTIVLFTTMCSIVDTRTRKTVLITP